MVLFMIDINMFKEVELHNSNIDTEEAEALCEAIYKRLKNLRFIKSPYRDITGAVTFAPDKNYWFLLDGSPKIKIIVSHYHISCSETSIKWDRLTLNIKMQLIKTLPDFLKIIEDDLKDMSNDMVSFVNKFKNINLDNTWK
jgi:hypothetical protein